MTACRLRQPVSGLRSPRDGAGPNPPPGCGGVVPGSAGLDLGPDCTEKRSLRLPRRAECAFPSRRRPGGAGPNPPPVCGALWKMAQLGKCARATPRQAAGGFVPGSAGLDLGPDCTEKRSLGRGSLMARPELGRDTTNQAGIPSGCQLLANEIPGLRVRYTCSSCHLTKAQLISL